MLEARDISFSYKIDGREFPILKRISFKIERGDFVAIQGPSGSGKSTLFYLLGLLLQPDHGQICLDGQNLAELSSDERALIRNQRIGFVFQQFHLIPRMSALDNILLPTRYPVELATTDRAKFNKAHDLSKRFGITDRLSHFPNQLSGGQQQRVAIARALINDVDLILADEPTGNLDSHSAAEILGELKKLNQLGKTIVIITHDSTVARQCDKVFEMSDGVFVKTPPSSEASSGLSQIPKFPKIKNGWQGASRVAQAVWPMTVGNLRRNKAKSALTLLGVIIGIAAVLSMITLGQFTKEKILETFETLGANKFNLRGYMNWDRDTTEPVPAQFKSFDWERDLLPLTRLFPEIQALSPVLESWRMSVAAGGRSVDNEITSIGVAPQYFNITHRILLQGIPISPFHIANRSPVCVIGYDVASKLFKQVEPLGQVVTIVERSLPPFPCRVIGVLASVTSTAGWSVPNYHVLLPYTYFATVGSGWDSQIHQAVIQVRTGTDIEEISKKAKNYFEKKYGKSGNFHLDSDSTLIAQMKRFLNLFTVFLTAIAMLSLLIGGVGINNMMLVSVTERLKEFGIRKALGATDRSIRAQVLAESVFLCSIAGAIGVILGFASYEVLILAASLFAPSVKFVWVFDPVAASLSVASIIAVGIGSGFVPALRAERLQIIDALRSE